MTAAAAGPAMAVDFLSCRPFYIDVSSRTDLMPHPYSGSKSSRMHHTHTFRRVYTEEIFAVGFRRANSIAFSSPQYFAAAADMMGQLCRRKERRRLIWKE